MSQAYTGLDPSGKSRGGHGTEVLPEEPPASLPLLRHRKIPQGGHPKAEAGQDGMGQAQQGIMQFRSHSSAARPGQQDQGKSP